ncbi:unnamed protein product [marine sediment metagenome]|uniref:Uncharacterized protein n=1 Tax=marine sediment metagenome TaxID=412755 RepID=X1KET9_9ZZZZ
MSGETAEQMRKKMISKLGPTSNVPKKPTAEETHRKLKKRGNFGQE